MKKYWVVAICILIVITGCKDEGGSEPSLGAGADEAIPEAGEEDYTADEYLTVFKAWEEFHHAFTDADKTGKEDDNMCWAAVAANLLTWSGWVADEDDVFDIFRTHFDDQPGYVYDALSYHFANDESGVTAEMVSVRETRSHMLVDFIVSAVHEGNGAAIKITYPDKKIGHFLTIYGYRYLADEDNFILYFTDSDDGSHQIQQMKIEWNDGTNRWEIQNLYRDYYLVYAISLDRS